MSARHEPDDVKAPCWDELHTALESTERTKSEASKHTSPPAGNERPTKGTT